MNDQSLSLSPFPLPMQKEKIVKEDGRFLYFYSFDETPQTPLTDGPEKTPEDADV